mgnify:CR=1 FL=1
MNRIYSEQIERALALAEGLKKNSAALQAKGFDLSLIEKLEQDCELMAREGEAIAAEEEALAKHRAACHVILSRLKTNFFNGKGYIKQNYLQDQWADYGVPDKR